MDKTISLDMIKSYQKNFNSDPLLKLSRNAATHNEVTDLAMDWDRYRRIDHTFSHQVTGENLPNTESRTFLPQLFLYLYLENR